MNHAQRRELRAAWLVIGVKIASGEHKVCWRHQPAGAFAGQADRSVVSAKPWRGKMVHAAAVFDLSPP